jgi:hypothetical protein
VKTGLVNVINEPIQDQDFGFIPDQINSSKFFSYFESAYIPALYNTQDEAFNALIIFLNRTEKYFYDDESGQVYKLLDCNRVCEQSFKIRVV